MPKNKTLEEMERVSADTDISVDCEPTDTRKTEAIEDDGALIIYKNGVRAVFDIGQDRPLKEQNERIESVMKSLKMEKHIGPMVLHDADDIQAEEDEDEKENGQYECPWCGNRHN